MSGYTRQQSYIDGDVILAEHTNDEFDLLEEVFSTTLGHKHDGTTAEGPTIDLLSDNDGDTKIQVEEGADDDTIRFDTAGTERVTVDSTAISKNLPVRSEDGSAATPAYSFTSATNTGIYRDTSTGDLAFTAGGSKFLTVETTGGVRTTGDLFVERNSNQYIKIDQDDTVPTAGAITSFSATGNAKGLILGATTDVANTSPTAGTTDISFRTLGTETMNLSQAGVLTVGGNLVWHAGNDGGGSGLNADLLDGVEGSDYARLSQSNTFIGSNLTLSNTTPTFILEETDTTTASRITESDGKLFIQSGAVGLGQTTGSGDFLFSGWNATDVGLFEVRHSGANRTIWHAGNDGTGSGLDADLLDGFHRGQSGVSYIPYADSSGHVGIGSTSPFQRLVIEQSTLLSSADIGTEAKGSIHLQNIGGTPADGALATGISFGGTNSGRRRALIASYQDGTDGDPHGLSFFTYGSLITGSDAVSERLRISSSGFVGINNTSPAELLHIKDGRAEIENTGTGSSTISDAKTRGVLLTAGGMNATSKYTAPLMFGTHDPDTGASAGPLAYIAGVASQTYNSSTNVGMHLEFFTNPNTSGVSPSLALRLNDDGSAVFSSSTITAGGNTVWHAGNDGAASGLDADLLDGVQGSGYARLSQSNIFTQDQTISRINPVLVLKDSDAGSPSVVAGSIRYVDSSDTVAGTVGFSGGNNQLRIRAEDSLGVITFHSGGTTERARFEENGRFLLNTTNIVLFNQSSGSGAEFSGGSNEMVFTVNRSVNTSTGPCMITNKTDYVSGTVTHMQFRESGTVRGTITSNGSTTAYNTTSDYRLKENVIDLSDATSRLKELQPKRFNFIGQEMTVDGFIAHEVQAVVPEAVTGEKDGEEMQLMDASKLIPLLVATIKELEERISVLEGK